MSSAWSAAWVSPGGVLDAPAALRVLDAWASGEPVGAADGAGEDPLDVAVVADALLGLVLR